MIPLWLFCAVVGWMYVFAFLGLAGLHFDVEPEDFEDPKVWAFLAGWIVTIPYVAVKSLWQH